MVEQTHSGECHGHAVAITALDNVAVALGAAGLCDISYAALAGAVDIIGEGEEGVGAQGDIGDLRQPCGLLLLGEGIGTNGENVLPCAVAENVVRIGGGDIQIDSVVAVGSADVGTEG